MATLVKFYTDPAGVFAFFPQLNYNRRIYGNSLKTGYATIGQHTSISQDYLKDCQSATPDQYRALVQELENIGYKLKILPIK